jgi:hypothetical protein
MRTLQSMVLALGVAVWLSNPGLSQGIRAQRDLEPGGRGTGNLNLVQNEELQKELKLTPEQLAKIRQIPLLIKEKLKDQFAEMEKLEGKERREKSRELRKVYAEEFPKHLARILTANQQKRMKQIFLQQGGVQAFTDPDVENELRLTPKQKEAFKEIALKTNKDAMKIYLDEQDDAAASAKVAVMQKENMAQALAMLSDEQKVKWKELLGQPFEAKYEPARIGTTIKPTTRPTETTEPISRTDLSGIDKRVDYWLASEDERGMDRVGFAGGILEAERLAREHHRPVFLFNFSGKIATGRC